MIVATFAGCSSHAMDTTGPDQGDTGPSKQKLFQSGRCKTASGGIVQHSTEGGGALFKQTEQRSSRQRGAYRITAGPVSIHSLI